MKGEIIFFLLIFFTLNFSIAQNSSVTTIELSQNWQFRQVGKEEWKTASIPGCVHTDLLNNKMIEDPIYRINEKTVQWIDKENWEYRTKMNIDNKTFNTDNIELQFKGLDTYSEVYLNDILLVKTNNMFREWKVNCKKHIKLGENQLRIVFLSPIKIGLEKLAEIPYNLPGAFSENTVIGGVGDKRVSPFIRKAPYQFGWDFGPRLVTSGIWRPIYLVAWNSQIIRDLHINQMSIDGTVAKLKAQLIIASSVEALNDILLSNDKKMIKKHQILVKPGTHKYEIEFQMTDIELWWPNGSGAQVLYDIVCTLNNDKQTLDTKSRRIGLRTIEIVRNLNQSGGFNFKINGVITFMKGANYIPQDNFLNRVSPDRYDLVINSAVEANMNMLRVWGGGIYENDVFYDKCDEKGILIWQDFMFAGTMLPGDNEFLENVELEAKDNIIRLRNHPCIALWCGNNEILDAWTWWGWSKATEEKYGKKITDTIWYAYNQIFHKIIPTQIKENSPDIFYWSSSPCADFATKCDNSSGDLHLWMVWWDHKPYDAYRKESGRFISEYGYQSFPCFQTVKQFALPEDFDLNSEVMISRQRAGSGNQIIDITMLREFRKPKNFESFLYLSLLVQAEAVKVAIESHRSKMPYCGGSLYWQINDCWPAVSWSSIDYYGRWKALHYYAKRAFSPINVSSFIDNDNLKVNVVSDLQKEKNTKLEMTLLSFDGLIIWKKTLDFVLKPNASEIIFNSPIARLNIADKTTSVLKIKLTENGLTIAENELYFLPAKELNLIKPEITQKITKTNDGYKVFLTTKKLAKSVFLELNETTGNFSDNYFDLMPGETKVIEFITKQKIKDFEKKIKIITLEQTYHTN